MGGVCGAPSFLLDNLNALGNKSEAPAAINEAAALPRWESLALQKDAKNILKKMGFRVHDLLGTGTFGCVYQIDFGQKVAA